MREKLIDLLNNSFESQYKKRGLLTAQHTATDLIANGVTMEAYDCHWATETAYKNGYKKGMKDAVKWIPVTERLPDLELVEAQANDWDLYPCLATIRNKRAKNGRYVGKAWWDGEIFMDSDCTDITYDVTHWMPLPEPPKGE